MKFMILPAKSLQCGDVVFADSESGIEFCGRVLGENLPHPHLDENEYRLQVVVGNGEHPEGAHTTISFRHDTRLGVAREDEHAMVDVAALLDELDGKKNR